MLLRRRLDPKPFHALYFPERGQRAVFVGTAEYVWPWSNEQFKHIDLSDFDLVIGFADTPNNPPARTSDNLPCSIKTTFWLRPLTDAESLKAATLKFAALSDLKTICGVEHFKSTLRAEVRAIVQRAAATVSYVDLLSDSGALKRVESTLQTSCETLIKRHGFDLLGFDTQVEVIKPSDSAFTEDLRKQWDEYQQRKAKLEQDDMRRASDNGFVKEQLKIIGAARLATQTAESALEVQRATDLHKEEIEKLVTAQKTFELEQARERDRINALLAEVNDATHRRDIQYQLDISKFEESGTIENQHELNKAKHANELVELEHTAKLAELRRLEEELSRKELISKASHGIEVARLNAELAKLDNSGAISRAESIEKVGLAEARVLRENELARQATEIAAKDGLLKVLPYILSKSVAPAERLAEIRYLHLGGRADEVASGGISTTVLGAISTLPLVREVLSFIRDWDRTSRRSDRTAQPSSSSEGPRKSEASDGESAGESA